MEIFCDTLFVSIFSNVLLMYFFFMWTIVSSKLYSIRNKNSAN